MENHAVTKTNTQNWAKWKFVILGLIIMIFLGTVYSYGVFRLAIEQLFAINATQGGLPYMMALSFYALFMFLTGRILEKFHPRTVIMIGGALVALGWVLSAFAPNIYVLTITYGCIGGAGVGIGYGAPMNVVARWFPDKKGLTVGLVLVGFGVSPLVTAPIISMLISRYSLMNTFLVMGIGFMVVLPLLAWPFCYPLESDHHLARPVESNVVDHQPAQMLRTRQFKGLYLNFILATMIGLTMIGMTTSIGVDYVKLDRGTVTAYMAVFAIFNGLGRPSFGWLTDHMPVGKTMTLSFGLITVAALLLLLGGANNHGTYLVAFALLWFNLGGWLAIAPTATMKLYGISSYTINYGIVFTAYGIGAIVGVLSSGALLDLLGHYTYLFYYVIGLCLVGLAVTKIFFKDIKS